MNSKFFVTFGQKYRHEKHPSGLNIHPDGYVIIYAESWIVARRIAFDKFGDNFSLIYCETDFNPHFFPLGPILELGNEETSSV